MKTPLSLALACALAALLSSCGGSGSHGGGPLPVSSSSPAPAQSANVEFLLHIPAIASASAASAAKNGGAHKTDFSGSTQSVTIAIGTQVLKTADVSATSSLCAATSAGGRTCTIGVNAPSGSDQFTVTAYDQANGSGNAIAQGAVEASTSAQPKPVNVIVTGTIVKVAVALSNSNPPAGTKTSVRLVVTGLDADGNVVMGSFTSPVSLQDSDTSGATSLSTTTVASSTTQVRLNYTGVTPFISATITASLSGASSASATFAPAPAFLSTYTVSPVSGNPVGPWNITKGPDGNMWVVGTGYSEVIKVAPNGGMTAYTGPLQPSDALLGIIVGSDANLWFAESNNSAIAKITTSGVITEYPLPQTISGFANTVTSPDCVALGKDGNVWFADVVSPVIGSITPSGTIAEYPLPPNADVNDITAGPDGNLWMSDQGDNAILKVATSGQVVASYPIPSANAAPYGIASGPDNNVWFVEFNTGKIGRITTAGTITEFATPTGGSGPISIVAGPDGKMWFTEMGLEPNTFGKIGYISTDGKQIRDFFGDGYHVPDLAFDSKGTLWYVSDQLPSGNEEIGTFAY